MQEDEVVSVSMEDWQKEEWQKRENKYSDVQCLNKSRQLLAKAI